MAKTAARLYITQPGCAEVFHGLQNVDLEAKIAEAINSASRRGWETVVDRQSTQVVLTASTGAMIRWDLESVTERDRQWVQEYRR